MTFDTTGGWLGAKRQDLSRTMDRMPAAHTCTQHRRYTCGAIKKSARGHRHGYAPGGGARGLVDGREGGAHRCGPRKECADTTQAGAPHDLQRQSLQCLCANSLLHQRSQDAVAQ